MEVAIVVINECTLALYLFTINLLVVFDAEDLVQQPNKRLKNNLKIEDAYRTLRGHN